MLVAKLRVTLIVVQFISANVGAARFSFHVNDNRQELDGGRKFRTVSGSVPNNAHHKIKRSPIETQNVDYLNSVEDFGTNQRQSNNDIYSNTKMLCMRKYDLEDRSTLEAQTARSLKMEIAKLNDLVQVLRDQQFILSILNDIKANPDPSINAMIADLKRIDFKDQARPKELAIDLKTKDEESAEIMKLRKEIVDLKKQLGKSPRSSEGEKSQDEKVVSELRTQKEQIALLKSMVEKMETIKTTTLSTPTQSFKSRSADDVNRYDIEHRIMQLQRQIHTLSESNDMERVGAPAPQPELTNERTTEIKNFNLPYPNSTISPSYMRNDDNPMFQNLQSRSSTLMNTLGTNTRHRVNPAEMHNFQTHPNHENPEFVARKSSDDLLDLLTKSDSSETTDLSKILKTLGKEDSAEDTDLQRLLDLQKQLKKSKSKPSIEDQLRKLQKQLKKQELESKTLDDDDDLKTIQKAIKKLSKSKVQSKSEDEDNLDELKSLTKAIKSLQPKDGLEEEEDDGFEEKNVNFEAMIEKLQGGRRRKLSQAQIQVLRKRLMGTKGHSSGHGYGHGGGEDGESSEFHVPQKIYSYEELDDDIGYGGAGHGTGYGEGHSASYGGAHSPGYNGHHHVAGYGGASGAAGGYGGAAGTYGGGSAGSYGQGGSNSYGKGAVGGYGIGAAGSYAGNIPGSYGVTGNTGYANTASGGYGNGAIGNYGANAQYGTGNTGGYSSGAGGSAGYGSVGSLGYSNGAAGGYVGGATGGYPAGANAGPLSAYGSPIGAGYGVGTGGGAVTGYGAGGAVTGYGAGGAYGGNAAGNYGASYGSTGYGNNGIGNYRGGYAAGPLVYGASILGNLGNNAALSPYSGNSGKYAPYNAGLYSSASYSSPANAYNNFKPSYNTNNPSTQNFYNANNPYAPNIPTGNQNADYSKVKKDDISLHKVFEQLNTYDKPDKFFPAQAYSAPDYKQGSQNVASNPPQSISYTQPASNGQQKVDDLKSQIYGLQNVIDGFNKPEYTQKPEDKQTVYSLDKQIKDLKTVINTLQDTNNGYAEQKPAETATYPPAPASPPIVEPQQNSYNAPPNADPNVVPYDTNHKPDDAYPRSNDFQISVKHPIFHQRSMRNSDFENHRYSRSVDDVSVDETDKEEQTKKDISITSRSLAEAIEYIQNLFPKFNKSTRKRRSADDPGTEEVLDAFKSILSKTLFAPDTESSEDTLRAKHPHRALPKTLEEVNERILELRKQLELQLKSKARGNYGNNFGNNYGYNNDYNYGYGDKEKEKDKKKSKKADIFDKIFDKILDKIIEKVKKAIPKFIEILLGFDDSYNSYDNNYDTKSNYGNNNYGNNGYGNNGYGDEFAIAKTFKGLGIAGFLPMLILKFLSKIQYIVGYLQKFKFFKTFLIPALVLLIVSGAIIFLIWWLQSDENNYKQIGYSDNHNGYYAQNSYTQPSNSYNGYNNNIYRNSNNQQLDNLYYAKPKVSYSDNNNNNNGYYAQGNVNSYKQPSNSYSEYDNNIYRNNNNQRLDNPNYAKPNEK